MLMLDVSGSMAGTRLQVMKESVITMLDQYDALGDVMVRVVTFSSSASAYQSNWVSVAEAKAYVNGLSAPGTSTNYDAALQTAMKAFADAGKIAGGKNVSYFLTDGAPNAGTDWSEISGTQTTAGIQANEEALWKGFLESNQINSFAYGMGTGATTGQMNPVAYDGVGNVDTSSVVVADIAELVALQAKILTALWCKLKPGGTLLYATCSVLPEENSQQIQAFLSSHADARLIPLHPTDTPQNPGQQLLPGDGNMDGFYYAKLIKL